MATLEDIIDSPENLEVKRALAVKMFLFDFKTEDICTLLNVSDSFVSKWKIMYENEGASALKVNYQGGTGFLTEQQRIQILLHLENKPHCSVEELRDYIESHFGIVYQSKQSYYDLLRGCAKTQLPKLLLKRPLVIMLVLYKFVAASIDLRRYQHDWHWTSVFVHNLCLIAGIDQAKQRFAPRPSAEVTLEILRRFFSSQPRQEHSQIAL